MTYSLFKSYMYTEESIPFWLALSVVITSTINSVGSYGLLPQVPTTSQIASLIFPPYKETFKRTIAMIENRLRNIRKDGLVCEEIDKDILVLEKKKS